MARAKHIPAHGTSQADRVRELHEMVREARTLLTNPTNEALDACRSRLE